MIDSRDLRIGNLILGVSDRIETIYSIGSQYVGCAPGKSKLVSPQEYADINGIPLTEEWLLKAGFYYKGNSSVLRLEIAYHSSDNPCTLQVSGDCIQVCRSGIGAIGVPIEYVHQLQNLYFCLTGQELQLTT